MSPQQATGTRRAVAVVALAVASPVCAEFVQGYLPVTGDPLGLLGALLVLAPLYGGAALLIREAAVRTGRGWPGILLLAAAFGVLQAGVIDLSLFLGPQTGLAVFDRAGEATMVGGAFSAAMATTWIGGHVVMSIGTPLALADWFAPGLRGCPWLGRIGIGVVAALFVGAAALIHVDQRGDARLTWWWLAGAGVVAALLAGLAFTALGRPLRRIPGRIAPRAAWLVVGAFAGKLTLETLPATWQGVAAAWLLLVAAAVLVARAAHAPDWAERHVAALAAGALLAWTVVGFLAPDLPGVEPLHRYLHNAAFALAAVALVMAVLRGRPAAALDGGP